MIQIYFLINFTVLVLYINLYTRCANYSHKYVKNNVQVIFILFVSTARSQLIFFVKLLCSVFSNKKHNNNKLSLSSPYIPILFIRFQSEMPAYDSHNGSVKLKHNSCFDSIIDVNRNRMFYCLPTYYIPSNYNHTDILQYNSHRTNSIMILIYYPDIIITCRTLGTDGGYIPKISTFSHYHLAGVNSKLFLSALICNQVVYLVVLSFYFYIGTFPMPIFINYCRIIISKLIT